MADFFNCDWFHLSSFFGVIVISVFLSVFLTKPETKAPFKYEHIGMKYSNPRLAYHFLQFLPFVMEYKPLISAIQRQNDILLW